MLVLPWRVSGADAALSCCSYPAEPAFFTLRLDGNPAVYFFVRRSYSQLCAGLVEKAWDRRPDWHCVRRYFHRNRSGGLASLIGLGAALFALQGMTAVSRVGEARLYWFGTALYFVAGIAYSRIALLRGELGLMTWLGAACLGIALFVTNYEYLRYTTLSNKSASPLPRGLRRHNTVFIVIILGLIVLLAAGVGRWIGHMLLEIIRHIVAWLTRSSGESEAPQPEELQEPPMMFIPEGVQKPGLLSQILDILFYVLGGAVVAAIVVFALHWLYKNAGGFWKRSIDRLLALLRRQDRAGESAGYRDEESSIFSWEEKRQKWGQWRGLLPGSASARSDMRICAAIKREYAFCIGVYS